MSKEADLEDAVVALIQANLSDVKTCEPYDGDIDEYVRRTVSVYPAVMVHTGRITVDEESEDFGFLKVDAQLLFYIISRNPRSKDERRTGAYDICEDLRNLFHKKLISTDEIKSRLRFQLQDVIDVLKGMCIYHQQYNAKFTLIGS